MSDITKYPGMCIGYYDPQTKDFKPFFKLNGSFFSTKNSDSSNENPKAGALFLDDFYTNLNYAKFVEEDKKDLNTTLKPKIPTENNLEENTTQEINQTPEVINVEITQDNDVLNEEIMGGNKTNIRSSVNMDLQENLKKSSRNSSLPDGFYDFLKNRDNHFNK